MNMNIQSYNYPATTSPTHTLEYKIVSPNWTIVFYTLKLKLTALWYSEFDIYENNEIIHTFYDQVKFYHDN